MEKIKISHILYMNITKYILSKNPNIKIAVVSDLHDMPCESVISALQKIQPDVIFAVGDIMERDKLSITDAAIKNHSMSDVFMKGAGKIGESILKYNPKKEKRNKVNGYKFFDCASRIAPVIYSLGNHDAVIAQEDKDYLENLPVLGEKNRYPVFLLDNTERVIRTIKGIPILVGGLSSNANYEWLKKFSEKTGINGKILLCHHPEYLLDKKELLPLCQNFNLIVCGHTHGGQWRFFHRGVYASGQGMFPKYTKGQFGNMLISAGAANPIPFHRFGNPCEILEISLEI